jgi:hypothetical protein
MALASIDRRTRSDAHTEVVDPDTFFGEWFPDLMARNGDVASAGLARLGTRPLALDVAGDVRTLVLADGRLSVVEGRADGAVVVDLTPELFSSFAQQQQSLCAVFVGGLVRTGARFYDDLLEWDAVWLALLEGWAVDAEALTFTDRNGDPLDLARSFGPDDDPADIARFLREAGFVHLRRWLDPDAMDAIAGDVERALPSYAPGDGNSWWATTADGTERCVRLQRFQEHSPTTVEVLTGATWDRLRLALAGDDVLVARPLEGNAIEALVKPLAVAKGISDVPWHRDCNLGRHSYGCCSTTVGISVTPGGEGRGQLRVVAGSHRVLMPSSLADPSRSYLPVVPLPTDKGDLTVHLSCTLHEAQPPTVAERLVMYTGFGLPPRDADTTRGTDSDAISRIRENAQYTTSQAPSPLATGSG